jgi:hypothetical protein
LTTKRLAGLMAALGLGVALAGCAAAASTDSLDSATLTAAIDGYLGDHPERICTAPLFLPYDERVGDRLAGGAEAGQQRWLDGLAQAGLLVKARTTARGTVASGPTPVDEYAVSPDGGRLTELSAQRIAIGAPVRFCLADTRVGSILGITPRSGTSGARTATVRYRPALANRAAWAAAARTRSAMPWLSGWAREQLAERRVNLRQTASGWIVL